MAKCLAEIEILIEILTRAKYTIRLIKNLNRAHIKRHTYTDYSM